MHWAGGGSGICFTLCGLHDWDVLVLDLISWFVVRGSGGDVCVLCSDLER